MTFVEAASLKREIAEELGDQEGPVPLEVRESARFEGVIPGIAKLRHHATIEELGEQFAATFVG